MTTDTRQYDREIDAEVFGHMPLNLRAIGTAPGKDTMALIDRLAAELYAKYGPPCPTRERS